MQYQRTCLNHSQLAYSDFESINRQLKMCGARMLAFLADGSSGTAGYVAQLPLGEIIVVFRGSEFSIADWKTNFDYRTMESQHAGFSRALKSVLNVLVRSVRSSDKVIFTGHSLGGALATIAAQYLEHVCNIVEVNSFGAPRVAVGDWCDSYNESLGDLTFRHVNCCDIVPRLPRSWFYDYENVGTEIYYDIWGNPKTNPSQLYKFCDRGLGRLQHRGRIPTRGITDHALSAYRKVVK